MNTKVSMFKQKLSDTTGRSPLPGRETSVSLRHGMASMLKHVACEVKKEENEEYEERRKGRKNEL